MTGKGKAPGFFDEKEAMSQLERRDYYDRRISEMVRLGYAESRWFKKTLDERGLAPSRIGSVKDLAKLPKISREELVRMEQADPPFAGAQQRGSHDRQDLHLSRTRIRAPSHRGGPRMGQRLSCGRLQRRRHSSQHLFLPYGRGRSHLS